MTTKIVIALIQDCNLSSFKLNFQKGKNMKKSLAITISIALLAIALLTVSAGTAGKPKKSLVSMQGTWELVSYKYGSSASGFTDVRDNIRRLKVINETHFIWVQFDTLSGRIGSSAGGSYTLKGNEYSEYLEYGLAMDSYIKQYHNYTVKVEGDLQFLSGPLTPGYKIEEIWRRVK